MASLTGLEVNRQIYRQISTSTSICRKQLTIKNVTINIKRNNQHVVFWGTNQIK